MRIEANGKNRRFIMVRSLTVPEMEDCIQKRMSDYEIGKKYRCSALTAASLRDRIMAERKRETERILRRADDYALIFKIRELSEQSRGDGSQHSAEHVEVIPTRIRRAA